MLVVAGPAGAAKIDPAPVTNTVTEGSSYDVVFRLDSPIIAMTPDPTVVVTLTVGDPSRVALSTTSVEWAASEWFQTRTVTVDVLADGVHNTSNEVVVSGATTSASEYYDGFTPSFTVSITDADPAPPPTTNPPTTDSPTSTSAATVAPTAVPIAVSPASTGVATAPQDDGGIARTGASSAAGLALGWIVVFTGLVLVRVGRVRPQGA